MREVSSIFVGRNKEIKKIIINCEQIAPLGLTEISNGSRINEKRILKIPAKIKTITEKKKPYEFSNLQQRGLKTSDKQKEIKANTESIRKAMMNDFQSNLIGKMGDFA